MLVIVLIFVLALVCLYAWFIEPNRVVFKEVVIKAHITHPVRFVLITDLHIGRFSNIAQVTKTLDRLRMYLTEYPADYLLLGGDFLDCDAGFLPELSKVLDQIDKLQLPMYAVLGNHDYLSCDPIDPLLAVLKACRCTLLRNHSVLLQAQGEKLLLIGVDDLEQVSGYRQGMAYVTAKEYQKSVRGVDWYERFDQESPTIPRILLTHNPDGVYLPGIKPLLVVAGHTHGGQLLMVDWLGRFATRLVHLLLPAGSFRTRAGHFIKNKTELVISRGLGGSHIPARFMRPPEILFITVAPEISKSEK